MKTLKAFRGVLLQATKDGRLFARVPYRGVYEVKKGDRIHHALGVYVVTGQEASRIEEVAA